MASGHRVNGVDFDDLFDPDIIGDGPSASAFRKNGVPLKYAKLAYGTKRADVGRRQGGLDVSNLWAQKNSASYAFRGGVPNTIEINAVTPPTGGNALVRLTHSRNGIVSWIGDNGGSGTWSPGGGTPGDNYDVMYTDIGGGTGTGTLTGATGAWQQVNADRVVQLSVTAAGGGSVIATRNINVQIRRRSDGTVLVNYNTTLYAAMSSDG